MESQVGGIFNIMLLLLYLVQGMEKMIQEEVELFKTFLIKNTANQLDMRLMFGLPVMNVLWKLICRDSLEYDDPNLYKYIELLKRSSG